MAKHDMTAAEIQDLLGLEPHPTCGFVRVTYVAGDEIAPGGLPAPFDTYHRNDQPAAARAAAGGQAPVVLAETADGMVMLLGPDELDRCQGSIDRLVEAVEAAVDRQGLTWPQP